MKKKQGFTLIELLAVIVILAVIALIATPLIMGTITKAKQNSFKDTAYGILKAAENYQAEQLLEQDGNQKPIVIKNLKTDTLLQYKGQRPSCGYLVMGEGISTIVTANGQTIARKSFDDKDIKVSKGSCKDIEEELKTLDNIVTTNLKAYYNYKSVPVTTGGKLVWKDLSGNGHDGEMIGFDVTSGYQSDGIHFDGIDDVINLGMENLDLSKGYTLQLRFQGKKQNALNSLLGNWEQAGGGLSTMNYGEVRFSAFIGDYKIAESNTKPSTDSFHTLTGTYDGATIRLYFDGKLIKKVNQTGIIKNSPIRFALGANPNYAAPTYENYSNIIVQSATVYNGGLTDEEVRHNYLADILNSNS